MFSAKVTRRVSVSVAADITSSNQHPNTEGVPEMDRLTTADL